MTTEEIKISIKEAIKDAIHVELGQYKVDKEQHYKDHIFLNDLREWSGSIKSTFWKTLVRFFVSGMVLLTLLGFIVWGESHIR